MILLEKVVDRHYDLALIGWSNGGNVTSARWQVTLFDPMWHVSSRSGAVLVAQTAICFLTLPYLSCLHDGGGMVICLVLAYGPADAAATHSVLLQ